MSEPKRPLLADMRREIGGLVTDLRSMFALRGRLAVVELRGAIGSIKRLAVRLVAVAILALVALSVLAVAAADAIGRWLALNRAACLAVCGTALLAIAVVGGRLAWRDFRRRFCGMEQTLEELREDVVWLKQWIGQIDEEPEDD